MGSEQYEVHGKPLLSPLYEKFWIPVWIRIEEAVESVRLTLISALEVWSVNARSHVEYLHKAEMRKNPLNHKDYRTMIKLLTIVNANAEKLVDKVCRIFAALIILLIFRRPL